MSNRSSSPRATHAVRTSRSRLAPRRRPLLLELLERRWPCANDLAPRTLFEADFERDDGGFVADNSGGSIPGVWHYSIGREADGKPGHSPRYNWYYGQFASGIGMGSYPLTQDHEGRLRSPAISLPDCGTVTASFNYFLDTRPELDRDFVEVAVEYLDGNVTRSDTVLRRADGSLPETSPDWRNAVFDLTPYGGRDVRLMFLFDSGDRVPFDPEGWYIDDVKVVHQPTLACFRADLSIKKEGTPDPVTAGQFLTYDITVENLGPSQSGPFTMVDTLPIGLKLDKDPPNGCEALPATNPVTIKCRWDKYLNVNEKASWEFVFQVRADERSDKLKNNAKITEQSTTDPNPANDEIEIETRVARLADLAISKTGTPNPVIAGQNLTYSIVVTNLGPLPSDPFKVVDTPPSGLTRVTPLPSDCVESPSLIPPTIECRWDNSLAINETTPPWTFVFQVPADEQRSKLENSATVIPDYPPSDPNPKNNTSMIVTDVNRDEIRADLAISKTGTPNPVNVGQFLTYNIAVTNLGPSPSGPFKVIDTLPSGLTRVAPLPSGCVESPSLIPPTIECRWENNLNVNETTPAWTFVFQVLADEQRSKLENSATVIPDFPPSDPNSGNNTSMIVTDVIRDEIRADLAISKTGTPNPVNAGQELTYSITVTNLGQSPSGPFKVVDTLPSGLTRVAPLPSGCIDSPSLLPPTIECRWGEKLPTNETTPPWTFVFRVPADERRSKLENSATVIPDYPPSDPNPENNTSTIVTDVIRDVIRADLAISKTGTPNPVIAGQNLTYSIAVTNLGPSQSGPFKVVDTLPSGLTRVAPLPGGCIESPSLIPPTIECRWENNLNVNETTPPWTFVFQVLADQQCSELKNVAEITEQSTEDPNPENNKTEIITLVVCAPSVQTVQFVTPFFGFNTFLPPAEPAASGKAESITPEPGTGGIAGYRWNDVNQNGMWDANERGMPGFVIYLDTNNDGVFNPEENEVSSVTDATGRFVFENLPPGVYTLREDTELSPSTGFQSGSTLFTFPVSTSHLIQVIPDKVIMGGINNTEPPNLGALRYSPFVRPADAHLEHILAASAEWRKPMLDAFSKWQKITFTNPADRPVFLQEPTRIFECEDINGNKIVDCERSFVKLVGHDLKSVNFPYQMSAYDTVEFWAFFEPTVEQPDSYWIQYPDWLDKNRGPFVFSRSSRLEFHTNDSGVGPFVVRLIGGSTFDSDINRDGEVNFGDFGVFNAITKDRLDLLSNPITANEYLYNYQFDINTRCPNGAGGVLNTCNWSIDMPLSKAWGGEDYGPLNWEFNSSLFPFISFVSRSESALSEESLNGRIVPWLGTPLGIVDDSTRLLPLPPNSLLTKSDFSVIASFDASPDFPQDSLELSQEFSAKVLRDVNPFPDRPYLAIDQVDRSLIRITVWSSNMVEGNAFGRLNARTSSYDRLSIVLDILKEIDFRASALDAVARDVLVTVKVEFTSQALAPAVRELTQTRFLVPAIARHSNESTIPEGESDGVARRAPQTNLQHARKPTVEPENPSLIWEDFLWADLPVTAWRSGSALGDLYSQTMPSCSRRPISEPKLGTSEGVESDEPDSLATILEPIFPKKQENQAYDLASINAELVDDLLSRNRRVWWWRRNA